MTRRPAESATPLGIVVVQHTPAALGLLPHVEHALVEVHVRPAEADQLAASESHGDREDKGCVNSQRVLEGRAGSGTYVAEPRLRVRVVRSSAREQGGGSPFHADMKAAGRQGDCESRTEAKVPAPAEIAARLGTTATKVDPWRRRTSSCPRRCARSFTRFPSAGLDQRIKDCLLPALPGLLCRDPQVLLRVILSACAVALRIPRVTDDPPLSTRRRKCRGNSCTT